jgi:hypothetical protein
MKVNILSLLIFLYFIPLLNGKRVDNIKILTNDKEQNIFSSKKNNIIHEKNIKPNIFPELAKHSDLKVYI